MKIFNILSVAVALAFLSSCTKTDVAKPKTETTVQIYITDGGNLSAPLSGVSVKLYESLSGVTNNVPAATGVTDANGMATITIGIPVVNYFVVAQKGTKSNYYNGLNPIGVFQTQAEIQTSAIQTPAAAVGSVKFRDTNGDGRITTADDLTPPMASIMPYSNTVVNTIIY